MIVAVLAVPLAIILTPAILADPNRPELLRPFQYLYVWLYVVLALWVVIRLWVRESLVLVPMPQSLPLILRRTHRGLIRQSVAAWILALLAILLGATLFTRQIIQRDIHATWVRIELDSATTAPNATLRYGVGPNDVATVAWQPYTTTDVVVRPLGNVSQLDIQHIQTDAGVLPLSQITPTQAILQQEALKVTQRSGALLTWPQASHAITFTLAPATGNAEILWFDQRVQVALQPYPVQVILKLPANLQGWALLPPIPIDQLALELSSETTTYQLRSLTVLATSAEQQWTSKDGNATWQAHDCTLKVEATSLAITTADKNICTIQLANIQPLNHVPPQRSALIWFGLNIGLMTLVWLFTQLIVWIQKVTVVYQPVDNRFDVWLSTLGERWNTRYVILGMWGISLIFHVIYALRVPMTYTNDSIDYYNLGKAFSTTFLLSSINSIRTPGYPMFIGTLITLFGDTTRWVILCQHIALSLLAPLTVWSLSRRFPLATGVVAGLLVACSPVVSICANIIWTESLFATCAAAALLIYIGRGESARGLLLCGVLVGIATMIRPTGLLLLVSFVGWLLLEGWCSLGNTVRQRFALIGSGALVIGYLAVAAPWHLHLRLVRDTFDLSRGHTNFTAWAAAVYQGTVDGELPINQPDRATWNSVYSWNGDPFALITQDTHVLKGDADDVQAFYTESIREAVQVHPVRTRDNLSAALMYNLAFVTGDTRFVYWAEITSMGQCATCEHAIATKSQ